MLCHHGGDPRPSDAPPSVASCTSYANWRAGQVGDMLPADTLTLLKGLCALDVALCDGLEQLPALDWREGEGGMSMKLIAGAILILAAAVVVAGGLMADAVCVAHGRSAYLGVVQE